MCHPLKTFNLFVISACRYGNEFDWCAPQYCWDKSVNCCGSCPREYLNSLLQTIYISLFEFCWFPAGVCNISVDYQAFNFSSSYQ